MSYAFFNLLAICLVTMVFAWMSLRKVAAHLRQNPEAAKVAAEHILAVLLMRGKEAKKVPQEKPPDIGLETNGQTLLNLRPK